MRKRCKNVCKCFAKIKKKLYICICKNYLELTSRQHNTGDYIMRTTVLFHVGRGGRFHNPGYWELIGIGKGLQDAIDLKIDNVFLHNKDKRGRFCSPFLMDGGGNVVCETPNAEVGELDFDGDYDRYVAEYLDDLSDSEIEIVADAIKKGEPLNDEEWEQFYESYSRFYFVRSVEEMKENLGIKKEEE